MNTRAFVSYCCDPAGITQCLGRGRDVLTVAVGVVRQWGRRLRASFRTIAGLGLGAASCHPEQQPAGEDDHRDWTSRVTATVMIVRYSCIGADCRMTSVVNADGPGLAWADRVRWRAQPQPASTPRPAAEGRFTSRRIRMGGNC